MKFFQTVIIVFGIGMSATMQAQTLATLGDYPISLESFQYLYHKNHQDSANAYTQKSLEAYLPLFINFKLKVLEAKALELGNTAAFRQEFETYRRQLAKPYLTDTSSMASLLAEAYERMQYEVRASHILVQVPPDTDTTEAYKKVRSIHQKALQTDNFGALAAEYSEDPSAKFTQGDLGYFTALQMVYPFENAAYTTAVGEVSEPVRSQFGYHVLKVTDKRPNRGSVRVAHLMLKQPDNPADSAEVRQNIEQLYTQLVQDTSRWKDLCRQFSDDLATKANAGILPWFSVGQMPAPFTDAAFTLQEEGAISRPVQTRFGWHIVRLLDKRSLAPLSEMSETLKQRIRQDSRIQVRHASFIERLKAAHQYQENKEAIADAYTVFDSTLLQGTWHLDKAKSGKPVILFSLKDTSFSNTDFFRFVEERQRPNATTMGVVNYARGLFNSFVETQVIAAEENLLPEKYPEYRLLLQEYQEGMLFFEIMQQNVWERAATDSAGLATFYKQRAPEYTWGKRVNGMIAHAISAALRDSVRMALENETFPTQQSRQVFEVQIDTAKQDFTASTQTELGNVIRTLRRNPDYVAHIRTSETLAIWQETLQNFFGQQRLASNRFKFEPANINDNEIHVTYRSTAVNALEATLNQRHSPLAVQITEGWQEVAAHEALQNIELTQGEHQTILNGRFYYVKIDEIQPPRQKTFEEAKGQAISDYQTYLEEQWLKSLREKYPVSINRKVLSSLVKKP